ncbi:putative leucine-rich repeat-containing protein DDB_G0290503 [Neodiprion pinetum]|uniref:putative leucine-rich repeat-containing protein DDB_G0290503 n=1 Tax=Neodiprion pinetum TaxID=441929 RepID=UPI00371B7747
MRWNFGGNLEPVRMICEYDWKECPIAVASYVWREIVTDVVDSLTREIHLWRTRWLDKSGGDALTKDDLIKVGFKMQDLELKINILTYKMQYGTWPMPHEIPTPSMNQLRNVKLTLSNTSRRDMWTKHHLHGYISKCIQGSEDDKSAYKHSSTDDHVELKNDELSQFLNRRNHYDTDNCSRKLKLLGTEYSCRDYERLVRTANECRRYMDEINESNKSLGLIDTSSEVSDQHSIKDIYTRVESDLNSCRNFLKEPKKWEEVCEKKSQENKEAGESKFTTLNFRQEKATLPTANKDRQTSEGSKTVSKHLPPGLSITFLSEKFQGVPLRENITTNNCRMSNGNKIETRTNESLNKVKDKLESFHDVRRSTENSKSLSSIEGSMNGKKRSKTITLAETNSATNSCNRDWKHGEKNADILDNRIFQNVVSTSDNETSEAEFNSKPFPRETLLPSREKMKGRNLGSPNCEHQGSKTDRSNNQNNRTKNDVNLVAQNRQSKSNEKSNSSGLILRKIASKVENLKTESDSSSSFRINANYTQDIENRHVPFNLIATLQRGFDESENTAVTNTVHMVSDSTSMEDNINLKLNRFDFPKAINKAELSQQNEEQFHQTAMETDEDPTYISQTSSQTEVSKDSDTDEKSTTTLLREALEFKKALLMQIRMESEEIASEEKCGRNESSECDSDDTTKSKTDNHFRSKILDIISEEQSAGSSTEKTSRTYILSRAISETNILEKTGKFLGENNNSGNLESSKNVPSSECYGDSKNPITTTSSEYFSANYVTDNEHVSSQKLNQCVADGDGIREMEISYARETPASQLKLDMEKIAQINKPAKDLELEMKKNEAEKESRCCKKTDNTATKESIDICKIENTITDTNSPFPEKEINEISKSKSNLESTIRNIANNTANNNEPWKNSCEKTENQIDFMMENVESSKEIAKIKFYRSLSSVDSEQAILWNSGSQSSSNDSIIQFVNTLANIESESIDAIADQKLLMQSSTDYEDINFAIARENSQCSFNFHGKKSPSLVSLSEINVCERSDDIAVEISENIENPTTSKLKKKPESKKTNSAQRTSCFKSDSVLNFDQEKLQSKQNIFCKLKALDALTEPLDIGECNSERNESTSIGVDRVEENYDSLIDVKEMKTLEADSQYLVLGNKSDVIENTEKQSDLSITKLEIIEVPSVEKISNSDSLAVENRKNNDEGTECEVQLQSNKKNDLAWRKSQLSKLSITNFSTDTSESYFDMSNHDFAVSSIILTSQNTNFGTNNKVGKDSSDTSSVYVDAKDNSSKIQIDLSKNDPIVQTDASTTESKHESLTKTQLLPKGTSSLPSNDHAIQNHQAQSPGLEDSPLGVESSNGFKKNISKCNLNLSLEKISSKLNSTLRKGKTASKSCIPVLKSRIDSPKRAKSMESKARSQSPIRRSSTPLSQRSESSHATVSTNVTNENERQTKRMIPRSKKSLTGKQSYTLQPKQNKVREECVNAEDECKTVESVSTELSAKSEKCNLLAAPRNSAKECTVIYINIISDVDRNEMQVADAKELIKYVNEQEAVLIAETLDSKSQNLSLTNIISNPSNEEADSRVNPTLEDKLSRNLSNELIVESEILSTTNKNEENNLERILPKPESAVKTANKRLSTSTLQISNSNKVQQKEMEVLAKPSVRNTSTSVSDFPDASPEKKCWFYNPNNEVFDTSKKLVKKEQIIISEMLNSDTTIYECKKTHKLFNKLGLGFQEQPE